MLRAVAHSILLSCARLIAWLSQICALVFHIDAQGGHQQHPTVIDLDIAANQGSEMHLYLAGLLGMDISLNEHVISG
jgi:hypothetical protein